MPSGRPPPDPFAGLPPRPAVSRETHHMAGVDVDVYGLSELPAGATDVSVLWLHHPRGWTREAMADIAARAVAAWKQAHVDDASLAASKRGLIAAAFDQRNHGSRLVRDGANDAWRAGNETHAQDVRLLPPILCVTFGLNFFG